MKKLKYLVIALVLIIVGGAGTWFFAENKKANQTAVKTSQVSSKQKTAKHDSKAKTDSKSARKSSEKSSQASTSSEEAPASNTSGTSADHIMANQLSELNQELENSLGQIPLSREIPSISGKFLNVRYTGNNSNYTIYYYWNDQSFDLNDRRLQNETPFAVAQKKSFSTVEAAQAQVNYQPSEPGLPTVALGSNIQGVVQGTTGSTYITWQEGRWSLTVQASANLDGTSQAKKMVDYFNSNSLPIPDAHGAVQTYVGSNDYRQNSISWTKDKTLYLIKAANFMTALEMGTSFK